MIAITFFGTAIAAIILPWRKKELYQNSPIARYKVAGIPLITIPGPITALFLGVQPVRVVHERELTR